MSLFCPDISPVQLALLGVVVNPVPTPQTYLLLTSFGFDYRTVRCTKGEHYMWKKTENEYSGAEISSPSAVPEQPMTEQAVIGTSLVLRGDVTGENDLLIQGQVEGKVVLKKNSVTVGRNGRVKADIYGKVIRVEGKVQGNLFGDDKIVISKSGDVRGNLCAPRVTLEEGARFKGSVDMEAKDSSKQSASIPSAASVPEKDAKPLVKEPEKEDKAGKSGLKLT